MIMIYLGEINKGEFPNAIVLKIVSLKVKTRLFLLVSLLVNSFLLVIDTKTWDEEQVRWINTTFCADIRGSWRRTPAV